MRILLFLVQCSASVWVGGMTELRGRLLGGLGCTMVGA